MLYYDIKHISRTVYKLLETRVNNQRIDSNNQIYQIENVV